MPLRKMTAAPWARLSATLRAEKRAGWNRRFQGLACGLLACGSPQSSRLLSKKSFRKDYTLEKWERHTMSGTHKRSHSPCFPFALLKAYGWVTAKVWHTSKLLCHSPLINYLLSHNCLRACVQFLMIPRATSTDQHGIITLLVQ